MYVTLNINVQQSLVSLGPKNVTLRELAVFWSYLNDMVTNEVIYYTVMRLSLGFTRLL